MRRRRRASRRRAVRPGFERIDPHRPGNVLEVLLAEIDEIGLNFPEDVIVGRPRKTNTAGLCDPLEPRGDIDAVAENVVAFDEHVAEVDADAIADALLLWHVGVALGHHGLDRHRAFHGGDDGGKLQQHAIARRLDEPAAERAHDRRRRLSSLAHRLRRPGLVLAHEARVADHVGGEDRGEAAGGGHCSGTPAFRRPSKTGSSAAR